MRVEIFPSDARGIVDAPPSKSAGHRLLVSAGLSREKSVIRGVAPSEDMYATMDCLGALGAKIEYTDGVATVVGIDPGNIPDGALLDCRECGSTLRFFVPIALLSGKKTIFRGSEKLFSRPMSVYEEMCSERGYDYSLSKSSLTVCGNLGGGEYRVRGDVSSQFISGLLFALPLCESDSKIVLTAPLQSRPYVDMTLTALARFGVTARFSGENAIEIKGGQKYRGCDCAVEGDYSNAAFFDALNLVGGEVSVRGLDPNSPQGDKIYREYFEKIKAGGASLDLSDCPDLGPVCMALAAELGGAGFSGTARLRIKESDRCECMARELAKFGCGCEIYENSMRILPSRLHAPNEILSSRGDHRIAMALSVLACKYGGAIEGAEAVNKSLPDFFGRLRNLGIKVKYDGMVK